MFRRYKGAFGRGKTSRGIVIALIGFVWVGLTAEKNGGNIAPPNKPDSAYSKTHTETAPPPANRALTVPKSDKERDSKQDSSAEKPADHSDNSSLRWTDIIVALSALASAVFAGILAIFTWRLIVVGRDQHKAAIEGLNQTRKALEIGQKEFLATHRPILKIRRIWPTGRSEFMGRRVTEVRTIISNIGTTSAYIVSFSLVVGERDKEMRIAFQADTDKVLYEENISIAPGKQAIINQSSELDIHPAQYLVTRNGHEVMAIGIVTYRDDAGIERNTGIARVYDPNMHRFKLLDANDPEADREYQD